MGNTFKDRKGCPRWSDSGKLVHRTILGPTPKGKVVHHIYGKVVLNVFLTEVVDLYLSNV